jgi:hypothetical protein
MKAMGWGVRPVDTSPNRQAQQLHQIRQVGKEVVETVVGDA